MKGGWVKINLLLPRQHNDTHKKECTRSEQASAQTHLKARCSLRFVEALRSVLIMNEGWQVGEVVVNKHTILRASAASPTTLLATLSRTRLI